jgi:hypothetical protein
MYYVGLDVHKRKISYSVKDSSGKLHIDFLVVDNETCAAAQDQLGERFFSARPARSCR